MKPDIKYTKNGLFTRFTAVSDEGENVIKEIFRVTGDNVIRNDHLKQTLKQIRSAGYTVSKAKPSKQNLTEVLNELEDLGLHI
tara:strand:+ start:31 stop:279 length:249 start_codon:yes stop_codon:yes gene_type:complete